MILKLAALVTVVVSLLISQDSSAELASDVPATLITLQITDQPIRQALEQLAGAANLKLTTNQDRLWESLKAPNVTVSLDRAPFWDAMSQICKPAGVMPLSIEKGQLSVMEDHLHYWERPAVVVGGFRVHAARIKGSSSVVLGRQVTTESAWILNVGFDVDPAIAALYCDPLKIDAMVDQDGQPIKVVPDRFQRKLLITHGDCSAAINFERSSSARSISNLSGTFNVIAVRESKPLEVPKITEASQLAIEVGGILATVTNKPAQRGYSVEILFDVKARPPAEWERLRATFALIKPHLFDANGLEYQLGGTGNGPRGPSVQFAQFNFNAPAPSARPVGPPQRFVYEIPTRVVEMPVPFEFKDLPLP